MLKYESSKNIIIFYLILIPKVGDNMIEILELTKDNENDYIDQVADLEQLVLEQMNKEGRIGQLFITGKQDISSYVHSNENSVFIAVNGLHQVIAVTYITQGQKPFTYNDITKYFKFSDEYKQFVKSQYPDFNSYLNDLLETYKLKLDAFDYSKTKVLSEYPEFHSIHDFLENELSENGFHEKSILRDKLNQYSAEYIAENYGPNEQKKYEQFYWFTASDIAKEFGKVINPQKPIVQDYEAFLSQEYDEVLNSGPLIIHEKPSFDVSKYFNANTKNSIELDTYLTAPSSRNSGIAKIIVYEGIKKHIDTFFKNPNNNEIFLCSTLHRDNISSRCVSEFFGLTDSLFVNRRQNRDREVHICQISREKYQEYLSHIENKLAVLYGYNPTHKTITDSIRKQVLQEQIDYETATLQKLTVSLTTTGHFKSFNGTLASIKQSKISKMINDLNQLKGDVDYGEI